MSHLDQLGQSFGTDKSSLHHNYLVHYERYFNASKPYVFWEIGIGGYHYPDRGGESLRMWRRYFDTAEIHGFDLYKKTMTIKGVTIHQADQTDLSYFEKLKRPDIVIDDASHINPLTIATFKNLFPLLNKGGVYVVEDTETSYWEAIATDGTDFKGSLDRSGGPDSSIQNFLKWLCDDMQHENTYGITGIHFYKGITFILK